MNLGGIGLSPTRNNMPLDVTSKVTKDLAAADEVATHFEAMFMATMLKEMRATLSEGLFGKEGSDTLGALFDMHMGQHLAEAGGIGLRELVAAEYAKNATETL